MMIVIVYLGDEVSVYCVHPGVIYNNFLKHMPIMQYRIVWWLYNVAQFLFCKTIEEGAQTTIYCAVSPDVAKQTGLYYR